MSQSKKKSLGFVAVAAGSAAAAIVGSVLFKDAQFARAKDAVEETRKELASADVGPLGGVFRNVSKVMGPSVVNISVTKSVKTGLRSLPFDADSLRRHFRNDPDGEPQLPDGLGGGSGGEDGLFESKGTGSGVIMEVSGGSGYILTNNHVAGGATKLQITLADGRVIDNGKLLGTDPKTDLAVIKVEADRLMPARWGDSDQLQQGDFVVAFGSPFGYIGSMTHGIVSALNRQPNILTEKQGYENFIQVDAPINPGNSGGPLTNLKGEVVGINTAIASQSGGFQGIGLSIPSNQAKYVYGKLKDQGKVVRGWLGVGIADVSQERGVADSFGFKGDKGVFVRQTFPGTPADGKLKPGDIVTEIDGKPVDTVQALRNAVAADAPGSELTLNVFRRGKTEDVKLKVGEQPEDLAAAAFGRQGRSDGGDDAAGDRLAETSLGMTLGDLTPNIRRRLNAGTTPKAGAVVTQLAPRSPAAKAGVRPGDVVTQVNDADVKNASEASEAIKAAPADKGVRLYLSNADGARFVLVKPTKPAPAAE